MKQLCKIALLMLWMFRCGDAVAQLQLISQSKIDSLRNPRTVTQVPISFAEGTTVQMGVMAEDAEPWRGELRWTNRGEEPLVVTRVVTTCGCLKAEFDEWPILADSVGTIRLEYHPKGHPGVVYQRAFVYTSVSDERPSAILVVSGEVTPVLNPQADYPKAFGYLRLRSTELSFRRGGSRQQLAIACYNGSSEPMRLSTDTLLTSPALRLKSEPSVLQPGEEGELIVTFDPSKAVFIAPTMPLYLRGLYLPPRQRQLTVRIN